MFLVFLNLSSKILANFRARARIILCNGILWYNHYTVQGEGLHSTQYIVQGFRCTQYIQQDEGVQSTQYTVQGEGVHSTQYTVQCEGVHIT